MVDFLCADVQPDRDDLDTYDTLDLAHSAPDEHEMEPVRTVRTRCGRSVRTAPSDVELALAEALALAARAGQWSAVELLTRELAARRSDVSASATASTPTDAKRGSEAHSAGNGAPEDGAS
ncbi:MAG: hypothetical protein KDC14_00235 [Planctomycetes bacterium]|nr:hypothetical protein [Planctomycetota bacterium]